MIKISYTANNKYQQSPRAWFLYYQMKIREEKIGSPLFFGNAMDLGLNTMLRNKMQGTKDDPVETFKKAFIKFDHNGETLDLRTSVKVKWSKADLDEDIIDNDEDRALLDKGYSASWVSMRRKGIMMIDAYEKQALPHLKDILSVQEYVKIPNAEGDMVIGYIDFIARFYLDESVEGADLSLKKYNNKIVIFDNKTSSQNYKPDSVKNSDQLGTYFEHPHETIHADYAGYIVVPKAIRKRKEPKIPIQIIIDEVSPEVIDNIFRQYAETIRGIKLGHFPCNESNCKSAPFDCPYKAYCASGGRDMTGLVQVKTKD